MSWQADHVVGRRSFVGALSADAVEKLRDLGTTRALSPGAILLIEGDVANRVLVIVEGLVKVTALRPDGQEQILALRGPGDLVGELGAIDGGPRSCTATAMQRTEVQSLSGDEFLDFISSDPDASLALMRVLAERVRQAEHQRVSYATDDVPTRLAACLLDVADRYGRPAEGGGVALDVAFTQLDLAAYIGSSRDAVARALQTWRRQDLVTTARRRVVLQAPDKLRHRYLNGREA